MRSLASLLLVFWLLTPTAKDALSQVVGMPVVSGYAELEQATTGMIYAQGIKNGVEVSITVKWVAGMPEWIKYEQPKSRI